MTTYKDSAPSKNDAQHAKMTLAQVFESIVGGNLNIRVTAYDAVLPVPRMPSSA